MQLLSFYWSAAAGHVTLTVEVPYLKEGISELKDGLADLKEAVASLLKEHAELVSAVSMIKSNMTDLQDFIESSKMEILNKIEQQLSCCEPGSTDKGETLNSETFNSLFSSLS